MLLRRITAIRIHAKLVFLLVENFCQSVVYNGIYGNSVSVPANLTHGIEIEFVQSPR